jgi:hypothetical protein
MSTAGSTPTSGLVSADRRTPQWDAQFRQAAEISYRELQLLVGRDFGVYWMDSYTATDDLPPASGGADADLLPDHLRPNREREVFGPREHPFPTRCAIRTAALSIEPSIYMDALMHEFVRFGGRIVIRKFDAPHDLMSLSESVIINCTGLGSKALFDGEELVPVKGQLSVLIPQPEVNYRVAVRMPAACSRRPMRGRTRAPTASSSAILWSAATGHSRSTTTCAGGGGRALRRRDAIAGARRAADTIGPAAAASEPGELLRRRRAPSAIADCGDGPPGPS